MIRIILLILLITNTAFGASAIDDTKPNMLADTIITGASAGLNTKVDKLMVPLSEADIRTNFATAKSEITDLQTNTTLVDSTDATCFLVLVDSVTGAQVLKTDAGITCNAAIGSITVNGGITGALTGNADTCTDATNVLAVDSGAATLLYPLMVDGLTGSQAPMTDGGWSYNASTNSTTLLGSLIGATAEIGSIQFAGNDNNGTAPARNTKPWAYTFSAVNDADNACTLGASGVGDCFELLDPTTHANITCFVHGTDTVLCQWLLDTDGNAIEIQDNEGGGAYTAGTSCFTAVGNDGIALIGAADGSRIVNELGQTETITCEMTYD